MTSRSLVLLSGEGTTIPSSEAKSLFLTYDQASRFESPSPRLLIAESEADPFLVGRRIAYARRVGVLVDGPPQANPMLKGKRVRFRSFDLIPGLPPPDPAEYLAGADATIDLVSPDLELTLVRADREYLAVTSPGTMAQRWAERRPRRRPYFHPSAIFPKLSRALVNLSRCGEGRTFLDPFAGTGSIPLEAHLVGAVVVAMDRDAKMTRGALANMKGLGQGWGGVVRASSPSLPVSRVDAVATDIPYGRASSTHRGDPQLILELALAALADVCVPGSHIVMMHPQEVKARGGPDLLPVEEHHLHVHKHLTRTITVLRRR